LTFAAAKIGEGVAWNLDVSHVEEFTKENRLMLSIGKSTTRKIVEGLVGKNLQRVTYNFKTIR